MLNAEQSIVNEVEVAIRAGSAEKCLETARRVTDLFLASAGSFNDEQVGLFDEVLERLIKTIEIRSLSDISARIALAETSEQLAGIRVELRSSVTNSCAMRLKRFEHGCSNARRRICSRKSGTQSRPSWPAWIAKCPGCATSPRPDASWRN